MSRARTAVVAVALTLAVGCGKDSEPRVAPTVTETRGPTVSREAFAASLTALCTRLGSVKTEDDRELTRAFAAFRDDVERLPQPVGDRDAIRVRLVEPLRRMVELTERSQEIAGKPSPSAEDLQRSIDELEKADAEFAVVKVFLAEYGVSGCDS